MAETSWNDAVRDAVAGIPDETGTWNYRAGSAATNATVTGRLVGLLVVATAAGVTCSVNNGNTISVPNGSSFAFNPKGQVSNPTIEVSANANWVIEYLT